MNKLKIITANEAKSDIKNIAEYIARDNEFAAINTIKLIKKTFIMLSNYPKAGLKKKGLKYKGIFVYTIKKRYSIIYKINNDEILFLRVLTKYQDLFAVL